MPVQLHQIVSGGQTGADRAALDAGMALGIAIGGACPKGRLAEDGPLASRYPLREITGGYRQRTKTNVVDSDGTVIFFRGVPEGGTEATLAFCIKLKKPYCLIDMNEIRVARAATLINQFITAKNIHILNIAGARESRLPGIYEFVLSVLLTSQHKPAPLTPEAQW